MTLTTFLPTGLAIFSNLAPVVEHGRVYRIVDAAGQVGVIVEPVACGIEVREVGVVWTCGQLDRNCDGFISADDADYYALCWSLGTAMAEYTGDQWVSGDDFDAFNRDFQSGVR